jgi:hypothetical protein
VGQELIATSWPQATVIGRNVTYRGTSPAQIGCCHRETSAVDSSIGRPFLHLGRTMKRALIGACIGAVCGVIALAMCGAWGGYHHADEWYAAPAPPPAEAAVRSAGFLVAYFWWAAFMVGGLIGGLAALGSWAVRPRRRV